MEVKQTNPEKVHKPIFPFYKKCWRFRWKKLEIRGESVGVSGGKCWSLRWKVLEIQVVDPL
jgi:hypothetical protein